MPSCVSSCPSDGRLIAVALRRLVFGIELIMVISALCCFTVEFGSVLLCCRLPRFFSWGVTQLPWFNHHVYLLVPASMKLALLSFEDLGRVVQVVGHGMSYGR